MNDILINTIIFKSIEESERENEGFRTAIRLIKRMQEDIQNERT